MDKETCLQAWFECVACFLGLNIGESEVSVELSCGAEHIVLSFPKDGPESEVLQTRLSSFRPGTRVGLLRTDRAFYVRSIETARDDTH